MRTITPVYSFCARFALSAHVAGTCVDQRVEKTSALACCPLPHLTARLDQQLEIPMNSVTAPVYISKLLNSARFHEKVKLPSCPGFLADNFTKADSIMSFERKSL